MLRSAVRTPWPAAQECEERPVLVVGMRGDVQHRPGRLEFLDPVPGHRRPSLSRPGRLGENRHTATETISRPAATRSLLRNLRHMTRKCMEQGSDRPSRAKKLRDVTSLGRVGRGRCPNMLCRPRLAARISSGRQVPPDLSLHKNLTAGLLPRQIPRNYDQRFVSQGTLCPSFGQIYPGTGRGYELPHRQSLIATPSSPRCSRLSHPEEESISETSPSIHSLSLAVSATVPHSGIP